MAIWSKVKDATARREHLRAEATYRSEVDAWAALYQWSVERCDSAAGRKLPTVDFPLPLRKGERPIAWFSGVELIQPRSTRITNYGSVSYRVGDRTRARAGQARSISVEEEATVDTGLFALTSERAVFTGSKRNVEWSFSKLVGVIYELGDTVIHVSNRQRSSGVRYPQVASDDIHFYLTLAIRSFQQTDRQF
jgi:hypothetical protein